MRPPKAFAFLPTLLLIPSIVACTANESDRVRPGQGPLTSLGEGSDAADHDCQIVLREVGRVPDNGGYATECVDGACWFVWEGTLDVASAAVEEGFVPELLFQSGANAPWWVAEADALDGAGPGYQRYGFRFFEHTVSPGMSLTSLMQTRIAIAPYLVQTTGGRWFDHNRVPGDLDSYVLSADNSWSIPEDASVCATPSEPAALESAQVVTRVGYPNLMKTSLKGRIRVAGGSADQSVTVHYQVRSQDDVIVDWSTVEASVAADGRWEFTTPETSAVCPHYCPRQVYQFAIAHTSGGKTYWDNNGGAGVDYTLANDIGGSVPVYYGPPAILDAPLQLAYADWDSQSGLLQGEILLKNLAYDKQVAIVYSTDGWNTVQSADAFFGRGTYDNQEYWRFGLAIANPGDDLRFAIRYQVDGETYWDNNLGRDYMVATP